MGGSETSGFEPDDSPPIDLGYLSLPADVQAAVEGRGEPGLSALFARGLVRQWRTAATSWRGQAATEHDEARRAGWLARAEVYEACAAVVDHELLEAPDPGPLTDSQVIANMRKALDVSAGIIAERDEELEHARAALAGDNEGMRLWMLDCGRLVEQHRERARQAESELDKLRQPGIVAVSMADLRTVVGMARDYARYDAKSEAEEQAYARLQAAAGEQDA